MAKSRVALLFTLFIHLPSSDITIIAFIGETKAFCSRCSCDCNAVEAFKREMKNEERRVVVGG